MSSPGPPPNGEPGPELRYERALRPALLAALLPDGVLGALVQRSRRDPREHLDLHLRGDQVTLYLGSTKVLDIALDHRGAQLVPQAGKIFKTVSDMYVRRSWTRWQPIASLARDWPAIERFIYAIVKRARKDGRHLREGATQAALAHADDLWLVDREWIATFTNDAVRTSVLKDLHEPLGRAVRRLVAADHRWAHEVKRFGNELDALLVDEAGRLLVMEVKRGSDTAGAGWTPAQVAHYLAIFERWLQQDQGRACKVLTEVLDQRAALGLVRTPVPRLTTPLRVVPVILLVEPLRNRAEVERRMKLVTDALAAEGVHLPGLEVWLSTTAPPSGVDDPPVSLPPGAAPLWRAVRLSA